MNIKFYRLRGIEKQLERLNDNLELIMLNELNISTRSKSIDSPDVSEVMYVDEEEDAVREMKDKMRGEKESDVLS